MRIIEGRDAVVNSTKPSYFVGLDLGQSADFSAVAVMERHGLTKDSYTLPLSAFAALETSHAIPGDSCRHRAVDEQHGTSTRACAPGFSR
jgi:hypothetical protein